MSILIVILFIFFFSSRRRHTRFDCDWSSDVCSSDLSTIRMSRCAMSCASLRRARRGDLVLPSTLRGVECLVGGAEKVLRVGRFVVREARDAEGCSDGLAVRERERGDDLPDPIRVEPGARLRGLDEKDRELVTAVAGDDIDPARVLHEDLRDLTQGFVTDRVAELVVDALEAIEVEEHDRHGVVEAPEARDLLLATQGSEP